MAMCLAHIHPLSLHDALPIYRDHDHERIAQALELRRQHQEDDDDGEREGDQQLVAFVDVLPGVGQEVEDRKSTRLNSSHLVISYAVFCLKKKNKKIDEIRLQ